jgi:DNA ligase-1
MPIQRRHLITGLAAACVATRTARARGPDAPAVLLAQVADATIDPAPYLVSEKYDGARALWDGQRLRFRSGRAVEAPAWFTQGLPSSALDGELWLGRGRFDTLSGIVRKARPADAEWRRVRYMVFESPQAPGTFEQRIEGLRQVVRRHGFEPLQLAPQSRIEDRAALRRRFDDTVRGGGEGLMLHRADALYVTGRSDALRKLKPLHDDEATVLSHVAGKGKYAGAMGALEVQTAAGIRFYLGSGFSDAQRLHPPAVGSVVTFTYRDTTPGGVPRFASYSRMADGF